MRQEMSYEQKYKMMVETPVNKLIPHLAIPTIISMLIKSYPPECPRWGGKGWQAWLPCC